MTKTEEAIAGLAAIVAQLAEQQKAQGDQIAALVETFRKPPQSDAEEDVDLVMSGPLVEVMHLHDDPLPLAINGHTIVIQPGPNQVPAAFAALYQDHKRDLEDAKKYDTWARKPKNLARQLRRMAAIEGLETDPVDDST